MLVEHGLSLFAIEGSRDYGERVAQHLDLALCAHEERGFEDGEHKVRPLAEVRRQDVFVITRSTAMPSRARTTSCAGCCFSSARRRMPAPSG